MAWYLISEEDVKEIRTLAKRAYLNVGCAGKESMENEFSHTLDTGLHTTDCIPDDKKNDIWTLDKKLYESLYRAIKDADLDIYDQSKLLEIYYEIPKNGSA